MKTSTVGWEKKTGDLYGVRLEGPGYVGASKKRGILTSSFGTPQDALDALAERCVFEKIDFADWSTVRTSETGTDFVTIKTHHVSSSFSRARSQVETGELARKFAPSVEELSDIAAEDGLAGSIKIVNRDRVTIRGDEIGSPVIHSQHTGGRKAKNRG